MSNYVYLAHHGIKGQKWGNRRYQNPDGSLTNEGRLRYSTGIRGLVKNTRERKITKLSKQAYKLKKKSDKKFDKYLHDFDLEDRLETKDARAQDKADKAQDKAYKYAASKDTNKNYSKAKEDKLWDIAGEKQAKADKTSEQVSRAQDLVDASYQKYELAEGAYKSVKNKLDQRKHKYIAKYGSVEYNSIPHVYS